MPYSSDLFDSKISKIIEESDHSQFLDIGCGAGKYFTLIKRVKPDAVISGIESHEPYVRKFKLSQGYRPLIVADAHQYLLSQPNLTTETAILGDVIEHFPKSHGLDIIHYLLYRTKRIIVVFPDQYLQYAYDGVASEAHMSAWNQSDFIHFDHSYEEKDFMRLVVITGYRG